MGSDLFDKAVGAEPTARDRHGLGVSTAAPRVPAVIEGPTTPYEIAAQEAARAIHQHGSQLVNDLKPFNPNLAQTVREGWGPRRTPDSQAQRNDRARQALPRLIASLRSPETAPLELFQGIEGHPNLAVALFALREEDRTRLADEYQGKLDEHLAMLSAPAAE